MEMLKYRTGPLRSTPPISSESMKLAAGSVEISSSLGSWESTIASYAVILFRLKQLIISTENVRKIMVRNVSVKNPPQAVL
jgi:hypothetical protein